jgi:hypothetical protein
VCVRVDEVTAANQNFSRSTLLTKENWTNATFHMSKRSIANPAWRVETVFHLQLSSAPFSNEQSLSDCTPAFSETDFSQHDVRSRNLKIGSCLVSRRVHPCPSGQLLGRFEPLAKSSISTMLLTAPCCRECFKVGEGTPSIHFNPTSYPGFIVRIRGRLKLRSGV